MISSRRCILFLEIAFRGGLLYLATGASPVTLKKLYPTRWSSHHDFLMAFKHGYKDVIRTLTGISLFGKNSADEK
jgi:hypothetical protein